MPPPPGFSPRPASPLAGPEAALARVAAAAAADPFAAGWPLAAAWLQDAAGQPAAALAELRLAALLAPGQPDILAALGHALAAAERSAEAEATLRAAIAARPGDLDLRNRLATVLWKANRLGAMLDLLEAAIADFGPHPTLLLNQALALNTIGEQEAGLAAAEAAIPGGGLAALVNRIAVLPYHPTAGTAAGLRRAAEAIGAALPAVPPLAPGRRRPHRGPLRLGLLSGGLGQHPVGWLTLAGLEALPEAEFTSSPIACGRAPTRWPSASAPAAPPGTRSGRWTMPPSPPASPRMASTSCSSSAAMAKAAGPSCCSTARPRCRSNGSAPNSAPWASRPATGC